MRLPYNSEATTRVFIGLISLIAFLGQISANDRKEWVKLADCHYVDAPDNDGDSFRVRGGDKEFTARLYYVDAPETNLRQGDRTHDQALHFGITLDETMKVKHLGAWVTSTTPTPSPTAAEPAAPVPTP